MNAESLARRVLVVDDDLTCVSFVCSAIENLGVSAATALTGSQALEQLAQGGWAGVILDLQLPDMHGVDVLRWMRESGNVVPVVILSGAATVHAVVTATRLGARDVLEKPIRLQELTRVVEQFLVSAEADSDAPNGRNGIRTRVEPDAWHATELVARDLAEVVRASVDTPTVSRWAEHLGLSFARSPSPLRSYSLECESMFGPWARRSRARRRYRPVSEVLACQDARTIKALLDRGGLGLPELRDLEVRQLLARQLYVRREIFVSAFLKNLEQIGL